MKFNLKNRPSYLPTDDDAYLNFTMKAEEWFEGFEKELRSLITDTPIKKNTVWYKVRKQLIYEILGDEK